MNDPNRDPESTKFGGEARAAQASSSTGGSSGAEGTMTPDYEGKDSFLGEGARVVSGGPTAEPAGDPRGGPAMQIDQGRTVEGGGDTTVHSHGQDDDSVRSAEESRKTDDRHP